MGEDIGLRIKQARKNAGLTQEALAAKMNVHPKTVSGWETGRREPSLEDFDLLTKILNVTMDDVLGNTNVVDPAPMVHAPIAQFQTLRLPLRLRKHGAARTILHGITFLLGILGFYINILELQTFFFLSLLIHIVVEVYFLIQGIVHPASRINIPIQEDLVLVHQEGIKELKTRRNRNAALLCFNMVVTTITISGTLRVMKEIDDLGMSNAVVAYFILMVGLYIGLLFVESMREWVQPEALWINLAPTGMSRRFRIITFFNGIVFFGYLFLGMSMSAIQNLGNLKTFVLLLTMMNYMVSLMLRMENEHHEAGYRVYSKHRNNGSLTRID